MKKSVSDQEPVWPEPRPEHVIALFEESSRALRGPQKARAGRRPLVSWTHLCLGMLVCALRGWNAQLELWRLIVSEPIGPFQPVQVTDQAIYNRVEHAVIPLQWVFEQLTAWLRVRQHGMQDRKLAPWASQVYATDTSTLDRLGRFLPWLRPLSVGDKAGLGGQISALLDVRRQQWVRIDFWPDAKDNCKEHVLTLLERVEAGALLLFDRGYLSFELFDRMTQQGLWWISRYANKVSYQISHVCYQADGVLDAVVYLGVHRSDQAKYPVRVIQFWWGGKQYRYLTNVLDPRVLPLAEVVRLYARRWDIELAFRLLKDHLNLKHLCSAKQAVVQVQLWCCLILAQLYHALQVEIAWESGVEVFDVSLDLLVRLTPDWLARGMSPLEQAVKRGREIGLIRPSTRIQIEVPWVDPAWVIPPPPAAIQPRARARYDHRNAARGPRPKKATRSPQQARS